MMDLLYPSTHAEADDGQSRARDACGAEGCPNTRLLSTGLPGRSFEGLMLKQSLQLVSHPLQHVLQMRIIFPFSISENGEY